MTREGILLLLAIAVAGGVAGFSTRSFFNGTKALLVAGGLAVLPTLGYGLWGLSIGCFAAPANESEASECFGWGFGLILLVIYGMPAWLSGLCFGYSLPWFRKVAAP